MQAYQSQQFDEAVRLFQQVLATDAEDFTVHYFLTNAIKYNDEGVPHNWTGAEEMMSK